MNNKKSKITLIIITSLCVIISLSLIFVKIFSKNSIDKNKQAIENAVLQTNAVISEKEFENDTFTNVLQQKLPSSLVFKTTEESYLINYMGENYIFSSESVEKTNSSFIFYDNLSDALLNSNIGETIFVKGFRQLNDGGNAVYNVEPYIENLKSIFFTEDNLTIYASENGLILISDENKTKSLVLNGSIINIYQMGYKSGENLDKYINFFTKNLSYQSIFTPEGEYFVTDNFDVDVSNKYYYGFNAKIICNDSYSPQKSTSGNMFYIYNNISNIKIFGFDVTVQTNKKLDIPMIGFLTARDVDGLVVNGSSFYLPKEAKIYSSSGVLDLFTNWKNVTVKNCRFENHSSTVAGGGIGVRDIYSKKCANALFENNYLYSNCRDEVIAIFSGVDTSLGYTDNGVGLIENVVFKNNTIIGGETDLENTKTPRVVGITVGYQKSLVKNIYFYNNNITMYSANYFFLYGKSDTVEFKDNDINIDASFKDGIYIMLCHNQKADEAKNIVFNSNNIKMINNSSLLTIAQTNEELDFSKNNVTGEKVYKIFDSVSNFTENTINFNRIEKCVYRNIKNTKGNIINSNSICVIYEFYNLNISNDILIEDDTVSTQYMDCNFMMFNGTDIYFNNHTITFLNFKLNATSSKTEKYYFLAYGTTAIKDTAVINFIGSNLSIYEDDYHKKIIENSQPESKVTLNFEDN